MIDVITMSSRGQIVIPSNIRNEMGLAKKDKFIIMNDRDDIIIRKLKPKSNTEAKKLLDQFAKKFERAGITADEVKDEIRRNR